MSRREEKASQIDKGNPYPPVGANFALWSGTSAEESGRRSLKETGMGIFGSGKKTIEAERDLALRQSHELQAQLAALQSQMNQALQHLHAIGAGDAPRVGQYLAELQRQVSGRQAELVALNTHIQQARSHLNEINVEMGLERSAVELANDGLYPYQHPADSSVALGERLEAVRAETKAMVSRKTAVQASTGFTFNNSEAQGRKFVADMAGLLLRSYNAEAENAILSVKAGNLPAAQKRLERARSQAARLGKMVSLRVDDRYHHLRLEELSLASRHLAAKQREKEEEREQRAQLREEQKARREFEAQKAKLTKERSHYENSLARLLEQGREEEAATLQAQLAEIELAIKDIDGREANIRAGYVYVISNVGAFGNHMVKIGMTRRLEPMDRINELGDASVPFGYDVHALFFSDDAVGVERELHRRFAEQRVNLVNQRREFFYASPVEVRNALKDIAGSLLEFVEEPAADQFRESESMRAVGVRSISDYEHTEARRAV